MADEQVAQTGVEPQGQKPQEGKPTGTAPVVGPDLSAEVEKWKGEADKLKGFQSLYTQAHQAGTWPLAEELLKAHGGDVQAAKLDIESMRQAKSQLAEIEKLGGFAKMREAYDIIYANPAETPVEVQPQPATPGANYVTKEGLDEMVRNLVRSERTRATLEDSMTGMVEAIAKDGGLATDGNPAKPEQLDMLRGALERRLVAITKGARDPLPGEVQAAAREVLEGLITPARASGAGLAATRETLPVPPAVNGRGPGGQQPAKPLSEMTEDEVNAAIAERSRSMMGDRPKHPTQFGGEAPAHWDYGT